MAAIHEHQRFLFDVQGYVHLRGALDLSEVDECLDWCSRAAASDLSRLHAVAVGAERPYLARPVSRVIDADPRFLRYLDHPATARHLACFLGRDYRHIDNDLLYTTPGYAGGGWHRGVKAHPTGFMTGHRFACPMVKVFYCLTDVRPGCGEFVVVPGSHKAAFDIPTTSIDLPGQRIFDDVLAGDVILFNEALLHNGRPHRTDTTRKTLVLNFGRRSAGVWTGYAPFPETIAAATDRQREILSNSTLTWNEEAMRLLGFAESDQGGKPVAS